MLEDLTATCAFGLYGLASRAGAPLIRAHLRRRARRGREDPKRLGERLGHASLARPAGPLVWLHGASVGEALSALPLIERLRAERPGLNLLLTTGTVTSARLLRERLPAGVIHQYAPVDTPAAVEGFFGHWRPELGLVIESELWPNLITAAGRRGAELVLLNGRMSPASTAAWRRFRPLIRRLLGCFSLVLAQSARDQERLRALGAVDPLCPGNLKLAAPALAADPAELARLAEALGTRPRWLAASTHPGEEGTVARAHADLAARHPDLVTVIVPRHPERGPALAEHLAARGHRVALRSRGDEIGPQTSLYLADTLGELGLWYRLAEVVFMGGSLVPKGGQNPLEPARLGAAILCGPEVANFAELATEMKDLGALRQVADGAELAGAVGALLEEEAARAAMCRAALDYATAQAGVLDAVMAALAPCFDRATKTGSAR